MSKTEERNVAVPAKLLREIQQAAEQRDGSRRLYKLDLRRSHLVDEHVRKQNGKTEPHYYREDLVMLYVCVGESDARQRGGARPPLSAH